MRRAAALVAAVLATAVAACGGGSGDVTLDSRPPASSTTETAPAASDPASSGGAEDDGDETEDGGLSIAVDVSDALGTISPLIRGLSDPGRQYLDDVGAGLNSWGGNPSSRYNFVLGNAWNNGRDWEYRNTSYGLEGDIAARFLTDSRNARVATRLAVPTLGWVASNTDNAVCSFPSGDGGCKGDGGANCEDPFPVADPDTANVRSTPAMVQAWVQRLLAEGHTIDMIAMDNEPELWGYTHYDVHPTCSTYEEILDRYLTYATAVREVAPGALLTGPVVCCWFSYWRTAPGPDEGDDADYVGWFLDGVRRHDTEKGVRTIDVLDTHFYPQGDVFNDKVDDVTAARRLRSVRALWDPTYRDESWISDRIGFVPRMQRLIDEHYPGLRLGISEWNFGADETVNGALAIADVLGVYGREGVYMAAYWRQPPDRSPGYFAFRMHGNYDGQGASFDGTAVRATPSDGERVSSYAALDPSTGHLKVMLINKVPDADLQVTLALEGFTPATTAPAFRYSGTAPDAIVSETVALEGARSEVTLPAYSITLLDLTPASA